ncbi:MAG: helix-turn-helix transcriptional regulator [Nostoc sp. LLA-1]|nr:helix-turn-helix transcriptional regulator [Cyanocohniella sp. LLY]
MSVKNKIKEFLHERGITAYQFRKEVGIAQRTAYDLYNNPNQLPSSTVLSKICDAYEVQPGELLEWVPKSEKLENGDKVSMGTVTNDPEEQCGLLEDKTRSKYQTQLLLQDNAA